MSACEFMRWLFTCETCLAIMLVNFAVRIIIFSLHHIFAGETSTDLLFLLYSQKSVSDLPMFHFDLPMFVSDLPMFVSDLPKIQQ